MKNEEGMIERLLNHDVVVDLASPYVCLGRLVAIEEQYLVLKDADVHDLRDTHTSRENYIISAMKTGIKRNRKMVYVARREVVALARAKDVVED
jgi:hypothetical protein